MVVFVEERRSHLLELHGPTIELFGQLAVPLDSRPEVGFHVILDDLRTLAVFGREGPLPMNTTEV